MRRVLAPLEVRGLITKHVPRRFLRALLKALGDAYREANRLGESIDRYERARIVGQNRWALSQSAMRSAGALTKIQCVVEVAGGGCPYTVAEFGPIRMTLSHVSQRTDMPRKSEFRCEEAQVANQYELFPCPDPDPDTKEPRIYLIGLHGAATEAEGLVADRPDFLRLIAPSPDFQSVLGFVDVPVIVANRETETRRKTPRPTPVLKTPQRSKEGEERE